MARFPEVEWFNEYARLLERNEEFRTHCRWFRGDIAFRVEGRAVTVGFDDGMVTGARAGIEGAQFIINGSAAAWDRLLNHDVTLLRLYRAGEIEIRGRSTELMKNWKAIFWITQGMKAPELSAGGD